ncbi:MAG: polysaccharide deacetylase family protein [Planctomycetes bacterium]|nr:polysaccharide deacetylase family protein [Planctomycetota bacterium]
MPPQIQIALATGCVILAAWTVLPTPWPPMVSAATVVLAFGWLTFHIVSPRSQWIVPTSWRGAPSSPGLALTFDDGPDPEITPRALELLREHDARATFFLVGNRASAYPDLVRRLIAAGHQIGSHSHRHAHSFHFLPAKAMAAEIERGIDAIAAITGERPTAFRPPIGLRVPTLRQALTRLRQPVRCWSWTARGLDTLGRPAAAIVARLRPHLVPGAILTLHDGRGLGGSADRTPTLAALRELLTTMSARGLRSIRLDELDPLDGTRSA